MTALSLIQSILAEDPISPGGRLAMSTVERLAALVPEWRGIESAPKDGTIIDVWREEGLRETVYWGFRPHNCGEMGQYCDSDWHSEKHPGWVCCTFGEYVGGKHNPFTHFMTLPEAPKETS